MRTLQTHARITCQHCKQLIQAPKKISTQALLTLLAQHCDTSKAHAAANPAMYRWPRE